MEIPPTEILGRIFIYAAGFLARTNEQYVAVQMMQVDKDWVTPSSRILNAATVDCY